MIDSKDKFKVVTTYLFLFTGILFVLLNISIYISGVNFAKEHNADEYKIGYHEVILGSGGEIFASNQLEAYPSFFTFYKYNDEGKKVDLIISNNIFESYNKLNRLNSNLYEGFKIYMAVVLIIGTAGIFRSLLNRRHSSGYIIATVISLLIIFEYGMLDLATFVYSLLIFLSAFLISKSSFIDYNKKIFPFFKTR